MLASKNKLKAFLKKCRSFGSFYIARNTLAHLKSIRMSELDVVMNMIPRRGRLLEIGAGAGWQAEILYSRGYDVSAIDLSSSKYVENLVWPVTKYDGQKIPFDDNSFDVVFSSNVLEHIPHVHAFQNEIHRVLKPDGYVIHVLPSSTWRLYTNITHLLRHWTAPRAHGEHAGNALDEAYYFSRWWWVRLFRETDWKVVGVFPNGLFYTGCSIMDARLSISMRSKLSHIFGSSCNIFLLCRKDSAHTMR